MNTELAPYSRTKLEPISFDYDRYTFLLRVQNQRYYSGLFSPAEIAKLQKHAHFDLYFGHHSRLNWEYHAVRAVVATAEASSTIAGFEGERYSTTLNGDDRRYHIGPDTEKNDKWRATSKQMVGNLSIDEGLEKRPHAATSYDYGIHICRVRRIPTFYADIDSLDDILWRRTQIAAKHQLPSLVEQRKRLFGSKHLSLHLAEAAQRYDSLRNTSDITETVGDTAYALLIYRRWGEYIKQRERIGVNTLGRITLEQLGPTPPAQRLRVLGFFGIKHQGGIEEWLRCLNLPFTSHHYNQNLGRFMPVEQYYTSEEHKRYLFINDFFWHHTGNGNYTGQQKDNFTQAIYDTPLKTLESMYDGYRFALQQALSHPGKKSEKIAQIEMLRKELAWLITTARQDALRLKS